MSKYLTECEINNRLLESHSGLVSLLPGSYRGTQKIATFVHKKYGMWQAYPTNILRGASHPQEYLERKAVPLEEVKERLFSSHKGLVELIDSTYKGVCKKAVFVHPEYGEWTARVEQVLNGSNHPQNKKLTESEANDKMKTVHGDAIKLVWSSFVGTQFKAKFIHSVYGEFEAIANNIFRGQGMKGDRVDRRRKTSLSRYGSASPMQNKDIAMRSALKSKETAIRIHWKTGEQLVCQASWEPKIVDYLNLNKIEYDWQSKIFKTPILTPKGNSSTYRPDLYLVKENKWVEIKGYFRKDALEKWEWFKTQFPTAELWDQRRLKEMGIL